MSVYLHPEIVAAGIAFLDDDKTRRLEKLTETLEEERDPEGFVVAVSEFLLREVGPEELYRQWLAYKTALADAERLLKKGRAN